MVTHWLLGKDLPQPVKEKRKTSFRMMFERKDSKKRAEDKEKERPLLRCNGSIHRKADRKQSPDVTVQSPSGQILLTVDTYA